VALATEGGGGIVVRGLKKKFIVMEKNEWGMTKKKVVQAVNGLDLTVADKTIFCLLGRPRHSMQSCLSLFHSRWIFTAELRADRAQWSGKDDYNVADYRGVVSR
jgi:hypothetical protein